MRVAFANAHYHLDKVSSGQVHIGQFIKNAVALGHKIWTWSRNQHPDVHLLPTSNIKRLKALRRMDALYVRLESTPPGTVPWALPPHRLIYGFPVVVWEINTIPDDAMIRGKSDVQVRQSIRTFQKYGRGCDLAVCVSQKLAIYVKERLGIQRTIVAAPPVPPASHNLSQAAVISTLAYSRRSILIALKILAYVYGLGIVFPKSKTICFGV